jgi:catechol 2,3-dioxygenase-like lactoylglutathione lyase family enzyme
MGRKPGQRPPHFKSFDHASMPCHDIETGVRFWRDVMGAEMLVQLSDFAAFRIAGQQLGLGSDGPNFMQGKAEYPHVAFEIEAEELAGMRDWFASCGIPVSDLWTRQGKEALMFVRDPSGNVVEFVCKQGWPGADTLPRSGPRGGLAAGDVETLHYKNFTVGGK